MLSARTCLKGIMDITMIIEPLATRMEPDIIQTLFRVCFDVCGDCVFIAILS